MPEGAQVRTGVAFSTLIAAAAVLTLTLAGCGSPPESLPTLDAETTGIGGAPSAAGPTAASATVSRVAAPAAPSTAATVLPAPGAGKPKPPISTPRPAPKPRPKPAAPRHRSKPKPSCDRSYPTVCIPPAPPDLDCGQITARRFAVRGADPHGFDRNHDGVGCES